MAPLLNRFLAKSFIKHKHFFINSTIDLFASLTQKGLFSLIFKQELLKIWIVFQSGQSRQEEKY